MAPQRCITFLSFITVIVLICIACYNYSYHEDVGDYRSSFSRAYAWYTKTIKDFMFQELDGIDSLASVSTTTYDVDSFGAKGDGKKDDTKAFKKAWKKACSSTTAAVFHVAKDKKYLVAPISFKGPCKASLTMQILGTILASEKESKYKKDERHWLRVDRVENLVIDGGGIIDGNGDVWWRKSCKVDKTLTCTDAPTETIILFYLSKKPPKYALTLYKCTSLMVNNLKIQNAQKMHVSFDNCKNVKVSNVQVTAPEDSPNTDGIHVTHTQDITIFDSIIRTGDDCISIVSGSKGVQAAGITCGPGHGISIGSLGSKNSEAHVSDVTIDGAKITGTENGVRIKTWQGGTGNASNIIFRNIIMENVTNPIIIDQNYCDQDKACKEQDDAVEIINVTYQNITGTSAEKDAVIFDCSKSHPCQGIVLKDINITRVDGGEANTICNNVELTCIRTVIPQCPKNIDDQRQLVFET